MKRDEKRIGHNNGSFRGTGISERLKGKEYKNSRGRAEDLMVSL